MTANDLRTPAISAAVGRRTIGLCIALGACWLACGAVGLDRQANLELSALSHGVIVTLASCAAAVISLWYFSPATRANLPDRFARLRRDNTLEWIARGMLGVALSGGMWAFTTFLYVSMLSQHFGASVSYIPAKTIHTTTYTSGRGICREHIRVRLPDLTENGFCLRARASPPLATFEPQPGEGLLLTVRQGIWGEAVTRVERRP